MAAAARRRRASTAVASAGTCKEIALGGAGGGEPVHGLDDGAQGHARARPSPAPGTDERRCRGARRPAKRLAGEVERGQRRCSTAMELDEDAIKTQQMVDQVSTHGEGKPRRRRAPGEAVAEQDLTEWSLSH